MPVVVIFRRHYVHYHGENIFSLLRSNWNVPNIHSQSIFAISSIVDNSLLISSFLRYVDEFEQDEQVYDNVIAVLSQCQSEQLPTRKNICQLVCSVAMSELVCRHTHALQAIHKGAVAHGK